MSNIKEWNFLHRLLKWGGNTVCPKRLLLCQRCSFVLTKEDDLSFFSVVFFFLHQVGRKFLWTFFFVWLDNGSTQAELLRWKPPCGFWSRRKSQRLLPVVLCGGCNQETQHATDSSRPRVVPAGLREWVASVIKLHVEKHTTTRAEFIFRSQEALQQPLYMLRWEDV